MAGDTISELVVRIKADASQLERELGRVKGVAQSSAGQMSTAFAGLKSQLTGLIPALSAAAFVSFGKSAFQAADHLNDLALQTGFAGSTLSALELPLKQSGSSVDDLATSVSLLNNNISSALGGNDALIKAFDALGLSVRELSQLSPEEAFFEIVRALSAMDDEFKRAEIGRDLLGRGFRNLAPLIKEAGGDLEQFVDTLKSSGNALTDEQLKRIDEFGDAWEAAIHQARLAMADFLPILEGMVKAMEAYNDAKKSLAATGIEIGARAGWIDRDVADEAILMAGEDAPTKITVNPKPRRKVSGSNAGLSKTKTDTEKARQALDDYIRSLKQENEELAVNEDRREALTALHQAEEITRKGNIELTTEERAKIEELAQANYDLAEAQSEAKRFAQELHDQLSKGLADAILDFDSATQSAENFAKAIANTILQRKVTGPLADAIIGSIDTGGLLNGLFSGFFADGGFIKPGQFGVVGERGPEFAYGGNSGMTISPMKSNGGTVVNVTHNYQSGVTKQELASIIPVIEARSKAAVFQAIERGGSEARAVGRRK